MIGNSDNKAAPINVAADSMYSFIRHANSGSANYDAPDLMLYMLAYADIYSAINFLQRTYGIAQLYAIGNRYLPDALLYASGFDPDDVRNNLAQFRYGINLLINKASALAVPNTMKIFLRRAMLYQNIYTEGPSIKDQLYMMIPESFTIFDLDPDTGAGMLSQKRWMNWNLGSNLVAGIDKGERLYPKTVSEAILFVDQMIQAIIREEDFGIMSGDILKAYGQNIIKLTSLPEYYPIIPMYDQWVLSQFSHARVPSYYAFENSYVGENAPVISDGDICGGVIIGNIKQNPEVNAGYLTSNSYYIGSGEAETSTAGLAKFYDKATASRGLIMNSDTNEVTPDQVIELTRLMYAMGGRLSKELKLGKSSFVSAYPLFTGTEICVRCTLWVNALHISGSTQDYTPFKYQYATDKTSVSWRVMNKCSDLLVQAAKEVTYPDDNGVYKALAMTNATSQFKHAIRSFIWGLLTNDPATKCELLTVDSPLANFSVIDSVELARLHEVAILNQLNVPSVGKANQWN